MIKIVDKLLHAGEGRRLKTLQEQTQRVTELEPGVAGLSDEQLRAKTAEFRQRYENGELLDDLLYEAFAVAREAAKRALGMRPFDVQVLGGIVLHDGDIAEMKTGEGKTLVATMPMYLNGLAGHGAHLVTVNDYLAKRDAEWMGQVYRFLGLEVGVIQANMTPEERRAQYNADVTYGTNSEFGFDYLRDNMTMRREHMVQRGHAFCIVDEVDSILIDEARTPLIISGAPGDRRRHLPPVRARGAPAHPRRGLRGRREAAHGGRHRERRRQGREGARHRQPLQGLQRRPGQPLHPGAARPGAVRQGRGVRRPGRRGAHRRRVHRPHPRGQAVLRGPAPGDRGQGEGADPRGEPDARDHHPAELLPHVRGPGRHDRYRQDRGGRVPPDLPARGRADPDQLADGPPGRERLHLHDRQGEVRRGRRRRGGALREGPAGAGRHRVGRGQRDALAPARPPRRAAQRAERQAARARGAHHRERRPDGRDHDRDQHGRPRRRHQARRRRDRRRRPVRARHRAPRESPHRQPAPRPLRPSGRPRREPVLPLGRRRAHPPVRRRPHVQDPQPPRPAGGRADRGQDAEQRGGEGAGQGRGAQLHAPQERAQVRRGDERAAARHLRPAPAHPHGRGLRRAGARDGGRAGGRRRARGAGRRAVRRRLGPRFAPHRAQADLQPQAQEGRHRRVHGDG